jgi:hypothetical protein
MLRRVAQPRSFVKRREGFKRAHDALCLTPCLRTKPGSGSRARQVRPDPGVRRLQWLRPTSINPLSVAH